MANQNDEIAVHLNASQAIDLQHILETLLKDHRGRPLEFIPLLLNLLTEREFAWVTLNELAKLLEHTANPNKQASTAITKLNTLLQEAGFSGRFVATTMYVYVQNSTIE